MIQVEKISLNPNLLIKLLMFSTKKLEYLKYTNSPRLIEIDSVNSIFLSLILDVL